MLSAGAHHAPASARTAGVHDLTGIAFSHYVEKARWALDRFGVPYRDHRVLPFFHFVSVHRIHGGRLGTRDKASSPYSTPVLVTPEGDVLCDSGRIVRYVSERFAPPRHDLDPGDDGVAIEQRLHDVLGPHVRRLAYSACFERTEIMRTMAFDNVSRAQATAFAAVLPLARIGIRRVFDLSEAAVARSYDRVRGELDWIGQRLADGRPYLVGDRFTSVDLAFACMAGPLLLPPEYSARLPSVEAMGDAFVARAREVQTTSAGQYALRLFRQERHRRVV